MDDELRKQAEAADTNWYTFEQLHEREANPIEGYREDADFIAAASPTTVLALLDERDEARAEALEQARLLGMGAERELKLLAERDEARGAVKRLAGALDGMLAGHRECDVTAIETLADPVVKRIVEGE